MKKRKKSFDIQAYQLNKYALENLSLKLQEDIREKYGRIDDPDESFLLSEVKNTLDEIIENFKEETAPDKILTKALSSLNKVEQKRFMLENLIEGIKRGENLEEMRKRYEYLGLLTINSQTEPMGNIIPSKKLHIANQNKINSLNIGQFLWGLFTGVLRNVARRLMAIITNAITSIPRFVKVVPIIGFTGVFPSLSFSIEADDMSIQDLWDLLIEADKQ